MVCVQVQVNVEGVRVDGAVKGRVGYGVRVEGRGEREQRGGMGLYKLEPVEQTSLYPMPATNSVTRGGLRRRLCCWAPTERAECAAQAERAA